MMLVDAAGRCRLFCIFGSRKSHELELQISEEFIRGRSNVERSSRGHSWVCQQLLDTDLHIQEGVILCSLTGSLSEVSDQAATISIKHSSYFQGNVGLQVRRPCDAMYVRNT
eukprot:scaffold4647_cov393-Prasinococcus_capsulatus_cf.AAC.3